MDIENATGRSVNKAAISQSCAVALQETRAPRRMTRHTCSEAELHDVKRRMGLYGSKDLMSIGAHAGLDPTG